MSHLIALGVDSTSGIQKSLESDDILGVGSNDFAFSVYTGGNISIGTSNDGGFVDVDATNAKFDFNVTVPGKYLIRFSFSLKTVGTISLSTDTLSRFRLTDGTNNSSPVESGYAIPLLDGFSSSQTVNINFLSFFNFDTAGAKSVKLQKRNITSSNVDSREVLANADSPLFMGVLRVAD